MFLRTETIPEKHFIGLRTRVTQTTHAVKTPLLWKQLMPRRNEIQKKVGDNLYSIQIFDTIPDEQFTPQTEFEKWAAIEVSDIGSIPTGFESLTIPTGLYAVFLHKGLMSDFPKTLDFIYRNWMPSSDYSLDHRPHFDIMTEKYSPTRPDSEEEIWVPIQKIN